MFITFEGGEGCGKSTQCKMLYDYLKSCNIKVVLTREIGGTISAEAIRDIVVNRELLPMSELMLVMAARYEHIHKLILPKLKEGYYVICDRFVDSTACYQGLASEIGIDKVYQLHQELMLNLMPDITFFIDVEPAKALHRALIRESVNTFKSNWLDFCKRFLKRVNINGKYIKLNNKFEQKSLDFHTKVNEQFNILHKRFPQRIVKIDGNTLTMKGVHNSILSNLKQNNKK